jgi:hypothetical protein
VTQVGSAPQARGYRRTWIDHTSELAASAETVSALLSDVDGWPSWTPGLLSIRRSRQTRLAEGGKFAMVLKPKGVPATYVPCQLLKLTPGLIEWGGGIGSSVIRHSFEIEALGPSRCRVRQLEYATGFLAVLTRPIEGIAHRHDLGWSRALEKRFAA